MLSPRMAMKSAGSMPLVIGNLNANLDAPRSRKKEVMAQDMGEHGLGYVSRHFWMRQGQHLQRRWTWRRVKKDTTRLGGHRLVHSRSNYILIPEAERKRMKNCRWIFPPPPL